MLAAAARFASGGRPKIPRADFLVRECGKLLVWLVPASRTRSIGGLRGNYKKMLPRRAGSNSPSCTHELLVDPSVCKTPGQTTREAFTLVRRSRRSVRRLITTPRGGPHWQASGVSAWVAPPQPQPHAATGPPLRPQVCQGSRLVCAAHQKQGRRITEEWRLPSEALPC